MAKSSSYLHLLQYDPQLAKTPVAKYLTNFRLVTMLLVTVVGMGLMSYLSLPRRLNPEVKIPLVSVATVLPGAGPADVESLITIPLEEEINGLEGLTKLNSTSSDNTSLILAEFESETDPKEAERLVQSAVGRVNDLPDDTLTPKVAALDFENQPVWTLALIGKGVTDKGSLMRMADRLENELDGLSEIKKVTVAGRENQIIQVLIKPAAVSQYGLSPLLLGQAVKAAAGSYPAGQVQVNGSVLNLTLDRQVTNPEQLRRVVVTIGGRQYLLGEVAEITWAPEPNQAPAYYADRRTEATPTVSFAIYKTSTADIDAAVAAAREKVSETLAGYEDSFEVVGLVNTADRVEEQFGELASNFATTILLVFVVLLVFLGARQALVASLSIPVTFLAAFTAMQVMGISLNFLSLFSLLLALGLLVDDAIVIISAMTTYSRTGKFTAEQTGLLVWRDYIVPIWTTTITTVWAFLPLLLSTGIIGEFIKSIPVVVTATLLASTATAVLITLPLMMVLLDLKMPQRVKWLLRLTVLGAATGLLVGLVPVGPAKGLVLTAWLGFVLLSYRVRYSIGERVRGWISSDKRSRAWAAKARRFISGGAVSLNSLAGGYKRVIKKVLIHRSARRKAVGAVVIFSIFSYALLPVGLLQSEFFPKVEGDTVMVTVELPLGTGLGPARAEAVKLLAELRGTQGVEYVVTEVGRGLNEFGASVDAGMNNILFTMRLVPEETRTNSSIEIAGRLREKFADYHAGALAVVEESGGPPVGADVQINFSGDDLAVLEELATQTENYLNSQRGLTNVNRSIKGGVSKLSFVPDQAAVSQAGLSIEAVGAWLRTMASGWELQTIKVGRDNEKIVFRLSPQLPAAEVISQLNIPTAKGPVPIGQLGQIELVPNPTLITRQDGERTLSVTATVEPGYSTREANATALRFVEEELQLPSGYSFSTGGANEENQKSVSSILQAMGISAVLIMATMVLQLGSYRKALIVLLVIPLAVSGVLVLFALTGTALSFPALIGVLALFGIVVNNSIMLVEKINQNIKVGLVFVEAIADAASSRLEPIALSSLTTVVGLLPITISDPMWRGLGGAIIAGLLFSGTVMLIFIPVVYYAWFREDWEETNEKIKDFT